MNQLQFSEWCFRDTTHIRYCLAVFLWLILAATGARAQSGVTFDFNDGLVPGGTTIPNSPDGGNLPNPGVGVVISGGLTNSACLILAVPGVGQTYGQWWITNNLAGAAAITNFTASFQLFMGNGSGGNAGVPNAGGNGFVFHVGPTPPAQFTGSDSTWGNGLDVSFRSSHNGANTAGINVAYNAVSGAFNPGAGTIIAKNSFLGFFQTNGAADSFSEAVTVSVTLTSGALSVACSNGLLGKVTVYANLAIPGFVPISPARMAFTATDGSGAHEDCWLDNVDLTINGVHLAPVHGTGPPQIVQQTGNVTASAGTATFAVAATGPLPYTYQWLFNGRPIGGATAAGAPTMMNFDYRNLAVTTSTLTIPAASAINNATYSVAVSNAYGVTTNIGSTLTLTSLTPSFNPPAISNGYNGRWLSLALTNWAGGTLYWATSVNGPWAKVSNGTNSQFTMPIAPSTPQCFYRAVGTNSGSNSVFLTNGITNWTRFYASTSFWNTPIEANPPIESNSTAILQHSVIPFGSQFENNAYSTSLAYACSTNKIYTVPCTLYGSPSCTPGGPGVQFPIPYGTQPASGTDGHLVVVYEALDGSPYAGKELDLWQAVYNSTNDTWSASTVTINDLYGWGACCPPGGQCNGADSAGFSLFGGVVRPEEIAQGFIAHALVMSTPSNLSGYIACPATHTDGTSTAPALPEGAIVQLDPAYNVDAQNWSPWLKIVAHALQTYGAYNCSTGGAVGITAVTDQNAGVPKWASVGVPKQGGDLNVLPWASMRVIQYNKCGN